MATFIYTVAFRGTPGCRTQTFDCKLAPQIAHECVTVPLASRSREASVMLTVTLSKREASIVAQSYIASRSILGMILLAWLQALIVSASAKHALWETLDLFAFGDPCICR